MITVWLQWDTVWLQCAKCLSTPRHSMYVVDSIFILYIVNLRLFLLYIKIFKKFITFVVYQLGHFSTCYATLWLGVITQIPKCLMQLSQKSTPHLYDRITQIPKCHNIPQAVLQKPWPYAVTKNKPPHAMWHIPMFYIIGPQYAMQLCCHILCHNTPTCYVTTPRCVMSKCLNILCHITATS